MKLLALVVALLAGCIQSGLVPCGELQCPSDATCHQGACVATVALEACAALADGTPCTFANTSNALCVSNVCTAVGCGTGVLDPRSREVCADSNRDNGDGCNADCTSNETCGNGVIDQYKGEACDDGNRIDGDSCQSTCLLPRCGDGVIDTNSRESCDDGAANADDPNAHCRSNCQLAHCGDGVKDADEICDDGNSLSGDGCSFDCKSNETCGNGYVDFARGEQCDNAVKLASDGCGERCELETQLAEPGPTLGRPLIACDVDVPTRGEHVFLLADGSTQILGRLGMQTRLTAHAPPARSECSMAYDPILDRVWVFGGAGQSVLADLWVFDGNDWSAINAAGPAARYGAGLVYETHRQRLLLFAGRDYDDQYSDTWAFANNQWTKLDAPSVGVAPPNIANWIYSPVEQRVLVITTNAQMKRFVDDHWEFDAPPCVIINDEIFCEPMVGMFARRRGTMSALPDGTVVFFGGVQTGCDGPDDICLEPSVYIRQQGTWRQSPNGFRGSAYTTHLENGVLRAYPPDFDPGNAPVIQAGEGARVNFIQPENRIGVSFDFSAYLPHLGATLHWGGAYVLDFSITLANTTWLQRGASWQQGPALNRYYCSEGVYLEHQQRLAIPCSSEDIFGPRQIMYTDGTAVEAGPLLPQGFSVFGYDPQRRQLVVANGDHIEAFDGTTWVPVVTTNPLPTTIEKLVPFRGELYAATMAPTVAMYVLRGDTWTTIDTAAFAGLEAQQFVVDPIRNQIVASVTRNAALEATTLLFNGTAWRRELYAGEPLVVATYDAALAALRPHSINPNKMLVVRTFDADRQRERCDSANGDTDEDGAAGCADPDCWWRCDPMCAPTTPASACSADRPRCGDGACSAPLENPAICPSDCAVYTPGW